MYKILAALGVIIIGVVIIFVALASRHAKVTKQIFLSMENFVGTLPLFGVALGIFIFITLGVVFGGEGGAGEVTERDPEDEVKK